MSSNMEIPKICTHCRTNFTAKKTSTQYCSLKCSQLAYKQKIRGAKIDAAIEVIRDQSKPPLFQNKNHTRISKPFDKNTTSLYGKEYLSLQEVAFLLGIERTTAYRYCIQGKLKCIKMNRKIFIRRKDIDGMFEFAPTYQITPRVVKPKSAKVPRTAELVSELDPIHISESITDFYTSDEIAEKYSYTKGGVHRKAARFSIPKITYQGRLLYSKSHVHAVFGEDAPDESISEWYLVSEIKSIYSLSAPAVYSLVSEYSVPKKNRFGNTVYSKTHIDSLLEERLGDQTITEWYTKEDIDAKYGLTPNYIANFVFMNKIPKKRINSKGYYSKEHFDTAIKMKNPQTVYITIEYAAECFSLSQDKIHSLIRKHNIPKVKAGKLVKFQKTELDKIINPPKLY